MSKQKTNQSNAVTPPVYCLDSFSSKAQENLFYFQQLQTHLHDHEFISRPHIHDHYLILYITKGKGTHTIDFVEYEIKPHRFFLMTPGQVHAWKLSADADGFICFFVPEFYQLSHTEKHLLEFPFFHSSQRTPWVQLPKGGDQMINQVMIEMLTEYNRKTEIDLRILRSYLDVVLVKLSRYYINESTDNVFIGATFKLRKLEELIETHYKILRLPSEYADHMNLSASYLNTLCKKKLGKTLTDLIHERVILEAKRYFAYSDLTVQQVADKLNFSEVSYFIRFFKKRTNLTPEAFKQSINSAI
jgi:AraC family transcriptional regulator, transcriptional activator of pobA